VSWLRRKSPPEALETEAVRRVLQEAIADLPVGAVELERGDEEGMYRLMPRSAGAYAVDVHDHLGGLDVFVADVGASIEIAAPVNINYGRPNRRWDEDVREVVTLVASGKAVVGRDASGLPLCLALEGSRLGVDTSLLSSATRSERGAVWS
jgi:hypothetical protein